MSGFSDITDPSPYGDGCTKEALNQPCVPMPAVFIPTERKLKTKVYLEEYYSIEILRNALKNRCITGYLISYFRDYVLKTFQHVTYPDEILQIVEHYLKTGDSIGIAIWIKNKSVLLDILNNRLQNLEIKKDRIYKNIQNLKKLLGLDEVEFKLFTYAVLYHNSEDEFSRLFRNLFELKNGNSNYFYHCINELSQALDMNVTKTRNALKTLLDSKALYSIGPKEHINLNESMQRAILSNKNLDYSSFLGKERKTSLLWKNFSHVKNKELIKSLIENAIKSDKKGINILLYGLQGSGKTVFASTLAKELKMKAYFIGEEEHVASSEASSTKRDIRVDSLVVANNLVKNLDENIFFILDEAEDLLSYNMYMMENKQKVFWNRLLEENNKPIIWICNDISSMDKAFLRRMSFIEKFEELDKEHVAAQLNKSAKKHKLQLDRTTTDKIISYSLPVATIVNSMECTSMVKGTNEQLLTLIESKVKVLDNKKMVDTETKLPKEYGVEFVNTKIDLEVLKNKIKETGRMNFSMCLYGPSGTGKSLYAKYIAKELGLEVNYKRCSDLISMYVGQTEINIRNAFEQAKEQKKMLIFDEADSFLQDRRKAQRSWEVTEVNEMLTNMEYAEYPFICTTNLMTEGYIDPAFMRRVTIKLKFDYLKKDQIKNVFQRYFGMEAPNSVLKIHNLALGDFGVVASKLEFFGKKDVDEIVKMLKMETDLKEDSKLSVGF